MNVYEIHSTLDCCFVGRYAADSESDALDAMARDSGYDDFNELESEIPAVAIGLKVILSRD